MVDNDTLKVRLMPHLKPLKLSSPEEEQMVRELNYLANLIIDGYLRKKKYGKRQTA